MSIIRLSKAVKDLNVGLTTAVEFLHKKGQADVEANPNFKISEEQYNLLVMEFSKDKSLKIESEKISQQRKTTEKPQGAVAIDGFEEEKETRKKQEEELIAVKINKEDRPQFKPVGKIDLDSLNKKPAPKAEPVPAPEAVKPASEVKQEDKKPAPKKEELLSVQIDKKDLPAIKTVGKIDLNKKPEKPQPKPQAEVKVEAKPAPQVEKQAEASVAPDKKAEVEIFTLNAPTTLSGPKIVNKIDLSSINDKTRPDKKTKEERRKERNERDGEKKKRNRIGQEKVDINKPSFAGGQQAKKEGGNHPKPQHQQGGGGKNNKFKKTVKVEVSEEDVKKQVKETLARLTEKKVKGAKYRKDKRENISARREEQEELDRLEDNTLKLTEFVTANDLAAMMNVSVNQVIGTCMSLGLMVSINQRLDAETINIVAEEFGFKTEFVSAEVVEAIAEEEDNPEDIYTFFVWCQRRIC